MKGQNTTVNSHTFCEKMEFMYIITTFFLQQIPMLLWMCNLQILLKFCRRSEITSWKYGQVVITLCLVEQVLDTRTYLQKKWPVLSLLLS